LFKGNNMNEIIRNIDIIPFLLVNSTSNQCLFKTILFIDNKKY